MSLPLFQKTDLRPSQRQMTKNIEATFWYLWEQRKLSFNNTQGTSKVWNSTVSQQLRSSKLRADKTQVRDGKRMHHSLLTGETSHKQHMTTSPIGLGGYVQGLWTIHRPSPQQSREQPISIPITSVFVQFLPRLRKYHSLCLSWKAPILSGVTVIFP